MHGLGLGVGVLKGTALTTSTGAGMIGGLNGSSLHPRKLHPNAPAGSGSSSSVGGPTAPSVAANGGGVPWKEDSRGGTAPSVSQRKGLATPLHFSHLTSLKEEQHQQQQRRLPQPPIQQRPKPLAPVAAVAASSASSSFPTAAASSSSSRPSSRSGSTVAGSAIAPVSSIRRPNSRSNSLQLTALDSARSTASNNGNNNNNNTRPPRHSGSSTTSNNNSHSSSGSSQSPSSPRSSSFHSADDLPNHDDFPPRPTSSSLPSSRTSSRPSSRPSNPSAAAVKAELSPLTGRGRSRGGSRPAAAAAATSSSSPSPSACLPPEKLAELRHSLLEDDKDDDEEDVGDDDPNQHTRPRPDRALSARMERDRYPARPPSRQRPPPEALHLDLPTDVHTFMSPLATGQGDGLDGDLRTHSVVNGFFHGRSAMTPMSSGAGF